MFQRVDEEPTPMSLAEAHELRYEFDLTEGRLVFRAPYGQPDSFCTEVFSRQHWVVLMVDLVAACSTDKGSYDDSGYMMWRTPEVLHPIMSGLHETQFNIGINSDPVEPTVAEERGYIVEKDNGTVQISIPYTTEGGYRKRHQKNAVCTESGISFKLDHRPFDYLWEITIDSDLLTSELTDQHGYIMSNDSNSLLLEVPLLSQGYQYEDATLKRFFGTFEITIRDPETSEVQSSSVKTCPFCSTELLMCLTDGRMTVVADLSLAIPSGGVAARTNLRDKYCGPKETDGTRALFSFLLNSCGFTIFFSKKLRALKNPEDPSNIIDRMTIQCTYPPSGLFRLFSVCKFESDKAGFGRIVHSAHSPEGLLSPTMEPTTLFQTPVYTTRRSRRPVSMRPGYQPPAKYNKVSSFLKNLPKKKATLQSKINPRMY
ncbi:hypothetical protein JOQ06_021050 [Pogonophryne albipinna]|uniref:Uncharacterized protein n=1 Tax=Pogonophryne albipinna TaxID=1090488 RepID=A0AAD6BS71_9TELE|nr:hypothetical protein JOQ06_021050 [Pogonophryne albipinna]